jgi:hypothetical protein
MPVYWLKVSRSLVASIFCQKSTESQPRENRSREFALDAASHIL